MFRNKWLYILWGKKEGEVMYKFGNNSCIYKLGINKKISYI